MKVLENMERLFQLGGVFVLAFLAFLVIGGHIAPKSLGLDAQTRNSAAAGVTRPAKYPVFPSRNRAHSLHASETDATSSTTAQLVEGVK